MVLIFLKIEEYSLILVHDICSIGYEDPIFHKIGSARRVKYLKIGGARGVPFMENTLWDMDNIGKKMQVAICLCFLTHPELIASIQNLGHTLMVTLGNPHLQLSTYRPSVLAIHVVYLGLSQID